MTTAYGAGDIPEIMLRHRLRIAREHIGLEQGELAERMGVSRNTISAAEKGKNEPRRVVITAWAMACGVNADWLRTGESPHPDDDPDGGVSAPSRARTEDLRIRGPWDRSVTYAEPIAA